MTTSFPSSLDAFTNPSSTGHLNQPGVKHSEQHANANDAIEAIESKLGVDVSNVTASIDYIMRLFLLTQTQHGDGGYREIEYSNTITVLPRLVVWYVDASKAIRLVEKEYTYGGSIPVIPTTITLRLYNGLPGNTLIRTITDSITYNTVFETARTRAVT